MWPSVAARTGIGCTSDNFAKLRSISQPRIRPVCSGFRFGSGSKFHSKHPFPLSLFMEPECVVRCSHKFTKFHVANSIEWREGRKDEKAILVSVAEADDAPFIT